jgi:hypothetical protein
MSDSHIVQLQQARGATANVLRECFARSMPDSARGAGEFQSRKPTSVEAPPEEVDGAIEAQRGPARRTWMGTLVSFFPAILLGLVAACAVWFVAAPGWPPLASAALVLYVLPLTVHRLHRWLFPIREGASRLVGGVYSPWYGTHQIQMIYIAFPVLEILLRMIPGCYSAWLRLWGSRIGRAVYWTPCVDIVDRGLVDVGDRVIFGHRSGIFSHVIRPTKGNLLLFVRRVRIGDGAFIGAGSYLAPGAIVEPGAMVPAATHVYPRQRVSSC